MNINTIEERQTISIAEQLAALLGPGDIVLLTGDLGAGKTTFTKGIAQGLDIDEPVTSPSFTLMNQYSGSIPLYHFDLYRIEDPEEFLELGIEEFLYGKGISVVEWSEKLPELPNSYLQVSLKLGADPEGRQIIIEPYGGYYQELVSKLRQEVFSDEGTRN
ncbi:tRNA (adenosine(37)-N6)-threonylcarbamoyltransferase complex ATPase subunit type 1 TsaE [Natranaerobius thermophilus]|uniref:tRNA threonylcarbamoyladenosine biosynthesis protein TsaE n=1 Tax=Natranaerobius thermophilus (strain ATCC BAA-1301 / DSM 18059 / JW/NM-WN-LF) TaxID=457570 RepID=B2A5P7_NATTJ|nr:tRNA (adenosine(37)-N6)-threonylcarbamoyltransferase complex ATPase subunit type 1 TsaE [Natranaerobius thermophilus]ACB83995.1 protein of unknown function UPF0079 [Natranaerobius thermophilus JW/NM-WN-LF]